MKELSGSRAIARMLEEGTMIRGTLGLTRRAKYLISMFSLSILLVAPKASAQSYGTWDGVWSGDFSGKRHASVASFEVRGGKMVRYTVNDNNYSILSSRIEGNTLIVETRGHHMRFTRTGDGTAEAIVIGDYNGRTHSGGLASGYGAGSAGAYFTRQ
jgi:hypothetical protein